jgi:hypothetical protein
MGWPRVKNPNVAITTEENAKLHVAEDSLLLNVLIDSDITAKPAIKQPTAGRIECRSSLT